MTVRLVKITFTSEHDIAYYEIYNRMNNLNDDRINGVTVELYDASNNVVYSKVISDINSRDGTV